MHNNRCFSPRLQFGLWRLRHQLQAIPPHYAETAGYQGKILCYLHKLSPVLCHDKHVQRGLTELRQRLFQHPQQYHVMQFAEDLGWKMAAHALPQGMQIPPHAHPGIFNLLLAVDGSIEVEQYSVDTLTGRRSHTPDCQVLFAGEGCVGLTALHNAHAIRAGSTGAIFLSLRLHRSHSRAMFCQQLIKALCGVGLVLSAFGSATLSACDKTDRKPGIGQQSDEAASLYRESLQYLHGDGVPVDRDKAKSLAYTAAGQGYQPAQTLYDEIINGFYDEMTGC